MLINATHPDEVRVAVLDGAVLENYQTEVAEKEYPTDYRQRHPIVLRQGAQNVDILLGRNRGGLTASQRADVVSFAQAWRN